MKPIKRIKALLPVGNKKGGCVAYPAETVIIRREAEKKRQSEDRRKEKQEKQRRSKEAETAAQAELGLPTDGHSAGRLPANVYVDADGFRLSKAQIDQAWEHVTQAGVSFWLNAATGEVKLTLHFAGTIFEHIELSNFPFDYQDLRIVVRPRVLPLSA